MVTKDTTEPIRTQRIQCYKFKPAKLEASKLLLKKALEKMVNQEHVLKNKSN